MNNTTLQRFAGKIAQRGRITFGDVCRLQRDILLDGVSTREEAELLIRLDGQVARADGSWVNWLAASITDFVVWGERPTGVVDRQAAEWLQGLLATSGMAIKAARRIADEVRREADSVEGAKVLLAEKAEIALLEPPLIEQVQVTMAALHQGA
jgi:hypothetical protein